MFRTSCDIKNNLLHWVACISGKWVQAWSKDTHNGPNLLLSYLNFHQSIDFGLTYAPALKLAIQGCYPDNIYITCSFVSLYAFRWRDYSNQFVIDNIFIFDNTLGYASRRKIDMSWHLCSAK